MTLHDFQNIRDRDSFSPGMVCFVSSLFFCTLVRNDPKRCNYSVKIRRLSVRGPQKNYKLEVWGGGGGRSVFRSFVGQQDTNGRQNNAITYPVCSKSLFAVSRMHAVCSLPENQSKPRKTRIPSWNLTQRRTFAESRVLFFVSCFFCQNVATFTIVIKGGNKRKHHRRALQIINRFRSVPTS